MHVITDCPLCNRDFMYHASDRHLARFSGHINVTEDGSQQVDVYTYICQECDEAERNCVDNYDCGGSMCRNGCSSMLNFNEPCAHFNPKTFGL